MGTDARLIVCLGVRIEDAFDYTDENIPHPLYSSLTGERLLYDGYTYKTTWTSKSDPDLKFDSDYELVKFLNSIGMVCISEYNLTKYMLQDGENSCYDVGSNYIFGVKLQVGEQNRAYYIPDIILSQSYSLDLVEKTEAIKAKLGVEPKMMVVVEYSR